MSLISEEKVLATSGSKSKEEGVEQKIILPTSVATKPTLAQQFNVPRRLFAFYSYATEKAALSHEERLAQYNNEKVEFEKALSLWDSESATRLRNLLESQRYVDWADIAWDALETFRSRGSLSILERALEFTYNTDNSPDAPEFDNMRRVNIFLKASTSTPTVERLLQVHKIAMGGGVEDIEDSELGVIRDYGVVGCEESDGLTKTEVSRVNKNPYLYFEENTSTRFKKKSDKTKRIYGSIIYPEPITIKQEALERIKNSAPDVYRDVLEFQDISENIDPESKEYRELTRRLVRALLEQVYDYHQKKRDALGDLDTPQKIIDYVKSVANQEREAISVHPCVNGNGRSIRSEILNDLFDKVGISRPRLIDPNRDILEAPSSWHTKVQKAILSTDSLYKDITVRILMNLRVESSPELLTADPPRTVAINIKTRGRKSLEKNVTQMPLSRREFAAYVDYRVSTDKVVKREYKKDSVKMINILREEYKAFAKDSFVYAHVPKAKKENQFGLVGLHLVDFDFQATLGSLFSENAERWNYKIDNWYSRNLVWRGMSDEEEVSDQMILDKFTKFSWLGLSNNLLEWWGNDESQIVEWAKEEFERYNSDVINNKLIGVVSDHINEGDSYDTSYGFSTSKRREIAVGFALGLGTYGYEKREVQAAQGRIKSRIVVGGFPAHKDVDVTRLNFIRPEFKYDKGQRQQEVMGVGAWDPDSIMVVQRLNRHRRAERSWVRNPNDPSEVWVIDGALSKFEDLYLENIKPNAVVDRVKLEY